MTLKAGQKIPYILDSAAMFGQGLTHGSIMTGQRLIWGGLQKTANWSYFSVGEL